MGIGDKHLVAVAEARERCMQARSDYYRERNRLRNAVAKAHNKGHSLRRIAEMVGVSNVTILNWSRDGDSK